MLLIFPLLLILPSATLALVDCLSGFVGRMQASVEDNPFHLNDTAMCSAMYCIKVIIHSALDDDGIFQQGISSRCAYTGGDRQVCQKNDGKCQDISFYDGMKGNTFDQLMVASVLEHVDVIDLLISTVFSYRNLSNIQSITMNAPVLPIPALQCEMIGPASCGFRVLTLFKKIKKGVG
ncbi:hypothetical protein GCK72_005440 [Caenorhabditis remanei]|uniref:Uncharacterized protein n=1 Tax=Caenorhabditis remanei TaxID=31234 RepID=A0A6A5HCJ5_CAERE|nr:hypothetical protein GCK72_005440 [Caenorhabditis remanei]KAF1765488.1 hypothetical protein GCK72_005440 [Caenorhabditis remanei]